MTEHGTARRVDLADHETELRAQAVDSIRRRRNFFIHIVAQIVGTVFLTIVWATTEYHNAGGWPTGFRTGRASHDWDPWIMYPLIASALVLGVHAWVAFGRRPLTEGEIAEEMERLRSGRIGG